MNNETEQRIAEIREVSEELRRMAAQILTPSSKGKKFFNDCAASLDTLAAECLRLREDFDWLESNLVGSSGPARASDDEHPTHEWMFANIPVYEKGQGGLRAAIRAARQALGAAKEVPLMNTLHPEIHKATEPALLAEIAKPLSIHSEHPTMSPCDHDECPPNACTRNAAKEAK